MASHQVSPRYVTVYLDSLKAPSIPVKKLRRSALNHFFDLQVKRHAVVLNPVSSVRNERYEVGEGNPPEITVKDARKLLSSIDVSTLMGIRDRAILAVLAVLTAGRDIPFEGQIGPETFQLLLAGE